MRVEYWDGNDLEMKTSEREYREVEDIPGSEEIEDHRSKINRLVRLKMYLDVKNGMVVHDVRLYETWLKENNLS